MKLTKVLSALFGLLAAALILLTLGLAFRSLDAPVRLVSVSDEAEQLARDCLNSLCAGEYETAGQKMLGQPELNIRREVDGTAETILWVAFRDSLSWEFSGEWYATNTGIARDVTIRGLDIGAMTEPLRSKLQTVLAQQVIGTDDLSLIYDENNNYREAFVLEALGVAAAQLLEETDFSGEWAAAVNLSYQDGQWWVLPEQGLINVIAGAPTA